MDETLDSAVSPQITAKKVGECFNTDRIYPEWAVNKKGLSVPSVWHSLWFP